MDAPPGVRRRTLQNRGASSVPPRSRAVSFSDGIRTPKGDILRREFGRRDLRRRRSATASANHPSDAAVVASARTGAESRRIASGPLNDGDKPSDFAAQHRLFDSARRSGECIGIPRVSPSDGTPQDTPYRGHFAFFFFRSDCGIRHSERAATYLPAVAHDRISGTVGRTVRNDQRKRVLT
jgi:hypothetical protein